MLYGIPIVELSVNIYFQLQYILSAYSRTTTPPLPQWVHLNTNSILSCKDETAVIHNNMKAYKINAIKKEQQYVPCKLHVNAGLVF